MRLADKLVQHAIDSYDTISPTGVLRLAEALQQAYREIADLEKQLIKAINRHQK